MPNKNEEVLSFLPQPLRFAISGGLGNLCFFFIDKAVYMYNPFDWQKATVSWAVSYLISVWLQHSLHTLLVFGRSSEGGYWTSLAVTYATYSVSIALSPVVNAALINYVGLSHSLAWFGTLASTGVLNYFTVSKAMSTADKDQKEL
ncbi:hypothetical protein JKP88DRAFT_80881 [Tribonema minus]|uniref:GtrA/DPMS transmembrane domain-containing protein n=1 Tax=Tribonema minus TaxID=303371 RepID=A0A835YNF2_9STRA|nr:hypothetical protein JKP88DRAFT_80881 [Tribonema minus]